MYSLAINVNSNIGLQGEEAFFFCVYYIYTTHHIVWVLSNVNIYMYQFSWNLKVAHELYTVYQV